jgi:hypothetical protein
MVDTPLGEGRQQAVCLFPHIALQGEKLQSTGIPRKYVSQAVPRGGSCQHSMYSQALKLLLFTPRTCR